VHNLTFDFRHCSFFSTFCFFFGIWHRHVRNQHIITIESPLTRLSHLLCFGFNLLLVAVVVVGRIAVVYFLMLWLFCFFNCCFWSFCCCNKEGRIVLVFKMTVVVVFQVARMASLESASILMELTFASDFALEFTLGKIIVRLG